MTTTSPTCATCGAGIEPEGAACASCLFQLAEDVGTVERACAKGFTPPDVAQLSPLMPDFEFEGLIGRGGMGAVYRVRQTRLGRPAALKVLPPERASDPAFMERFFREAQALAKLSHPNIVDIYDMGQRGSYLFILMEYVEGVPLRDFIRRKVLEPAHALRLAMQVCEALQYAHDRGIVHRDIKPENILVTVDGRVKLLDFGLVKLTEDSQLDSFTLTEINLRMGTPQYMAPEQMTSAHSADHRVDIYALGVLLYELLTGELPSLDYKAPSSRAPIDPRIDRVIQRAIRESPQERYQKAGEIRADIEHIVRTPRRRMMIAGAVAVLLAVTVVGAVAWYRAATAVDPRLVPGAPIDGVPVAIAPFSPQQASEHQERWAKHLGVPVRWTNSVGMAFVLIPPGEYTRGVPDAELANHFDPHGINPWERLIQESATPAHRVRLTRPFYCAVTETTQGQFDRVTHTEFAYFRKGMPGEPAVSGMDTTTMPAENLGFWHVEDFCKKLSDLEGFGAAGCYSVPTEAQWTFACMAGASTRFWYGATPDLKGEFEISRVNSQARTQPVATLKANPFGLYDMQGNVREYCSDWWSVSEYKQFEGKVAIDPTGPPPGTPGLDQRVICGGSFGGNPGGQSWMIRGMHKPGVWINQVGFRVIIPVEAVAAKIKTERAGRRLAPDHQRAGQLPAVPE